jgi:putative pyruvate formate lyase activating enzyme
MKPGYLALLESGELRHRAELLKKRLDTCRLCPRACGARRLEGERGECGAGLLVRIASCAPHFGEEPPLVGCRGSGTIFFAFCSLKCRFCQNWTISQHGEGREVEPEVLARAMLELQELGCHNVNLVTPSHYVPQIVEALVAAAEEGLEIPLVYNTSGYDSVETLRLLDGIVDIYMPDLKYADPAVSLRLSRVADYPERAREALREMHRQVGELVVDERGIAKRGMIVRHLVLPEGLAGTEEAMRFVARELSPRHYVNLMDQYRPAYRADGIPELARRITAAEWNRAVEAALQAGIERLAE